MPEGRVLQLSGERNKELKENNDKWHHLERSSGKFFRRFRLPENAKVDEVKAAMENGVLTVIFQNKSLEEMDDFGGGLDCNLRISGMVADSIMMGIVHSAMEHAFDKACSKEGVLERLNDKSRFCELAVMQLEWCLKFVQEETDKFFMIESSCEREKLLNELTETRDRIQRRLEETELAIWEKDREFSERLEIDFKLREAVEMKDRQLSSLRSNFDRSKSDSWVVGADDGRDGDFCELKNSVDKQFFNIKRKLEDERINFTFGMRKMSQDLTDVMDDDEPDLQQIDEESGNSYGECLVMDDQIDRPNQSLRRVFSTGFEKMGSDIDILKETLDAAFGIMSNAISLAEVGPMEQQWRWAVEKDIVFVVFKGFLQDVQGGHVPRIRERNEYNFQLSSGVNWTHLMDEIENLRNELDQLLVSHSEDRSKTVTPRDTVTSPPPVKNAATSKEIIFSKEKPPTDENDVTYTLNRSRSGSGKIDSISLQVSDQDNPKEPAKESQAGQGSLVAEMIRNHESIIRQKSEELNWLKGEIIREKGSAVKKDKGRDTMKKRIQDLVARLDSVIEGNKNLGTHDNDCRLAHESDPVREFSSQEVSQLNEDQEDLNLKTLMMDDVNVVVLKNIVEDLNSNLHNDDKMRAIRDDVCKVFLRETVEDWKHKIASYDIESHLREEVFYLICSEALRDAHDGCICKKYLANRNEDNTEETLSSNHSQNLESLITEDVQAIILSETVREWENSLESSNIETLIREEVFYNVICSAAKDITCPHSIISTEHQNTSSNGISEEDLSLNHSQDEKLESIIQNNVYMDFFREMVKEWKREVQNYNMDKWNSQSVSPFSDYMPQQLHARENDNLMQTLDSLSNCFEAEENLISLSSEMIEQKAQIEFFDERLVEVHHEGMLVVKDESLGSVANNLELILQQISMSKLQLKELRSCLGFALGYTKGGLDQMNSVEMTAEGRKDSPHIIEEEKEAAEEPSVLSTLTIFSKAMVDFECMVQETIGLSLSRLEKLKHQLDSSVEHVTSLRERELLYRKAFIMRCCNLQKAEAEVDLLADEQDDLLLLLEKIYIALDHYSPVLQHYFGIEEILKLIREELTGTATRFQ
ncbi:17.6 kDa class I heat shock protein [Thalictrum thalictroides]|uniref:17.6 kDa class I heat shock protein n=1 Tax=Thalictrum thalictroides TaxID=46969 RepID=A0A7J6V3A7_THATH|nr:17.6 kDa class I heat shock protein [Thalictrum thalictroides]